MELSTYINQLIPTRCSADES